MSKATSAGPNSASGTAPTRLRQIALVTDDLEKARRQLTYVIGTEVIFEDPRVAQWYLKNFLVPLGGDLIEVLAPTKPGTTVGRLIEKRGEGGYMIIMQTEDATQRRDTILSNESAKVIWHHEHGDGIAVQYHPKGIKGGMLLELDSHDATTSNPTPLQTRFSPWHACGPDYENYVEGMKRSSHLTLEGCVLRLAPGDVRHEDASRQWEEIFGVARSRDLLAFTNARLGFIPGAAGEKEGLVSVTVGVRGPEKLQGILDRAREEGLCGDGWINICNVKWYFVLTGQGEGKEKL